MELTLTYDLRAPAFGASRSDLYAAALDQVAWADELGFDVVGLGEHHGSEDGYNPSPLPLACAMAARTSSIKLRTSVLLAPLYDPVKLAEDAAVTQVLSNGRLLLGIGAGYRPSEFASFGRRLEDRWQAMGDVCAFLKQAWTGEPFEWQGRRCIVTPKPEPFAPPILLGGSSPAAARRAAHIADGWFPPLDARLWAPYRQECLELGKPDPGEYPQQGPIFLWISDNPDKAWETLLPHVKHQLQSYAQWTQEAFGRPSGPYAGDNMSVDTIKQSPAYQVLTPDEAMAMVESLGRHSVLYLNPLLAGIDPDLSWRMLKLYEAEVHPFVSAMQSA